MGRYRPPIDEQLDDWQVLIQKRPDWSRILVGNGFSVNMWRSFSYPSLFSWANSPYAKFPLEAPDVSIFRELETENFERVLGALLTTITVGQILNEVLQFTSNHYESIKESLVGCVHDVHIKWHRLNEENLKAVGRELQKYRMVFTTNYDLLLYWSMMSIAEKRRFRDFFFDEYFDISNTEIYYPDRVTQTFFLHGALHLASHPLYGVRKLQADTQSTLLEKFGQLQRPNELPLLITEGSAKEKLSSIYRSDYLSFAYSKLLRAGRINCVIFGHSLDEESDKHIIEAIKGWKDATLAFSMRKGSPEDIKEKKATIERLFTDADKILYFDSTTHPLGNSSLLVAP